MGDRPRVFLDASVVIAALLSERGGSFYIITELKDRFGFVVNDYVFTEVQRILAEKFDHVPRLSAGLLPLLGFAGVVLIPDPPLSDVRVAAKLISKNDAPILAGAWAGCEYLLTLDNEFFNHTIVKASKRRGLTILKPGDFIALAEVC